jgi:hypothetical protein
LIAPNARELRRKGAGGPGRIRTYDQAVMSGRL